MAGRPMTHSLAFVNFLSDAQANGGLQDLADQEESLVAELGKIQEKIKAVREKAQNLLLDVTPRQIAAAKVKAKQEQDTLGACY